MGIIRGGSGGGGGGNGLELGLGLGGAAAGVGMVDDAIGGDSGTQTSINGYGSLGCLVVVPS